MKDKREKRKRENIFTNVGFVSLLIVFFLLVGALGYYLLDDQNWTEAFYFYRRLYCPILRQSKKILIFSLLSPTYIIYFSKNNR